MTREETIELIESLFRRFGEGNWSAPEKILESMADDGEWWVAGTRAEPFDPENAERRAVAGTMTKPQMMEHLRTMPNATAGGLKITSQGYTIDGDRAAVEAISEMHLRDGREYRNVYHFLFVVKEGKFQKIKSYMDTAHIQSLFGSDGN